jgi:hypothetical protein
MVSRHLFARFVARITQWLSPHRQPMFLLPHFARFCRAPGLFANAVPVMQAIAIQVIVKSSTHPPHFSGPIQSARWMASFYQFSLYHIAILN